MFLSGGILWGPRRQQYPLAGGVSFVSSRPPGTPSVIKAGGILGSPPMAGMDRKLPSRGSALAGKADIEPSLGSVRQNEGQSAGQQIIPNRQGEQDAAAAEPSLATNHVEADSFAASFLQS